MAAISADPLVPVAFARDHATALRYARALDAAGIEAHVRIEDGAHLAPMGSAYGALTSGEPFVYPVLVSRLRRRAARRIVDDLDGPAEEGHLTTRRIATTASFVFGTALLVFLFAWARGDL